MKIYCDGRANGKTIKAIQLSAKYRMPIICWSYRHKEDIKCKARKMGVVDEMPEPIVVTEVRKKVRGNRKGLIVDDLDIFLSMILGDKVNYATMEEICDIENLKLYQDVLLKENIIPVQKVKDKIEDLKKQDKEWTEELSEPDSNFKVIDRHLKRIKNQIDILQELLEGGV